ncbi:MAG TPA: alpha/beta fold hydrolase [Steroidobacteraceae bacterium]|nr:alpha/beta fold hydrolase [Steroidobacteraceae bacterium]
MSELLPVVLIPGLLNSARLYAEQLPELWRMGPVTIADHTRDDSIAAIARRVLATAPPRFALAGLSMGGYIAFEILRQASERVARLALLDTSPLPDTAEASGARRVQMGLAVDGHFDEVAGGFFQRVVHRSRRTDRALRALCGLMAEEVGPAAYVRQQTAILSRADSRPELSRIRCPTLVVVGDGDELTPPERAAEMAQGIPAARLVTVPNCGHLCTLERPYEVTQALLAWLA